MKNFLAGLLLVVCAATASAKDTVYEGTWHTTNRQLDGTMTCVVTELGDNKWKGHFSGVWYGQSFSYKVEFTGPPDKLRGTAQVDGADYEWTGQIKDGAFTATFDGNRYKGGFNLKRKDK